jgi:hypothetical protein
VSGFLPVVASETLRIIVGRGGIAVTGGNDAQGYGGAGITWGGLQCASGGGRSAIQRLTAGSYTDIVTMGGGGAGGCYFCYSGGKATPFNQSFCGADVMYATNACCSTVDASCGGGGFSTGRGEGCAKGGPAAPGAKFSGGNASSTTYGGGGGGAGWYGGGAGNNENGYLIIPPARCSASRINMFA